MVTRKAWVLYDNNGREPFITFQSDTDPNITYYRQRNPNSVLKQLEFKVLDFENSSEPVYEDDSIKIRRVMKSYYMSSPYNKGSLDNENRYKYEALDKLTGISTTEDTLEAVKRRLPEVVKSLTGGKA